MTGRRPPTSSPAPRPPAPARGAARRIAALLALLAGCRPAEVGAPARDPAPDDTRPPVVAITAPAASATLSGLVALAATASDDVGVAGVQFLVDGAAVGSEDTSPPYWIALDASGLSGGQHAFSARARDAAGNTATATPVTATVAAGCWSLPAVTRARLYPRAGQASALAGGTIQGSNVNATNGFTVLATVGGSPAADQWTELSIADATPYRWVKYYGPGGSYGQVAEVELYAGGTRLLGQGFGTAGSRSGNPWQRALDGDVSTFLDGPSPSDVYVGLDLAAGHQVAQPTISPAGGSFTSAQQVTLATTTPGAALRYTTDGSDPAGGTTYTGPFTVSATATVRAMATAGCMLPSAGATVLFTIGSQPPAGRVTTMHIGNSLTDTVVEDLPLVAAAGGVDLGFNRYTVPGIGTWVYPGSPTGGFGVADEVAWVQQTRPIHHVVMQPFGNMPCAPDGFPATCARGDQSCAQGRSDAANMEQAWADAHANNPDVMIWVYQDWLPPPASGDGLSTCVSGGPGAWTRWSKKDGGATDPPAAWWAAMASWDDGIDHLRLWNEAVRADLARLHPSWKTPYIVPGGALLVRLEALTAAGSFPGVAAGDFFTAFFSNGGTDIHLTELGRYAVTVLTYAVLFQRDPRDLADTNLGTRASLTAAQAAAIQQAAYDTAAAYPLSGYAR